MFFLNKTIWGIAGGILLGLAVIGHEQHYYAKHRRISFIPYLVMYLLILAFIVADYQSLAWFILLIKGVYVAMLAIALSLMQIRMKRIIHWKDLIGNDVVEHK